MIIKNSKLFIGNLSFGYTRGKFGLDSSKRGILSASAIVYPNGMNAYDFYFQNQFEILVKKILENC